MNTGKIFDQLFQQGFEGIDVNIEISLLEYGLLYNPKTGQIIHGLPDYYWDEAKKAPKFGITIITQDELNNYIEYSCNIPPMLRYVGMEQEEWLQLPAIHQISDITDYCDGFDLRSDLLRYSLDELVEVLNHTS